MNTREKLEIFKKLVCLGGNAIKEIFPDDDHLYQKYEEHRIENGKYGNVSFLLDLDLDNSKKLLNRIGWREENSIDFMGED